MRGRSQSSNGAGPRCVAQSIATLDDNGAPQAQLLWFDADGDLIPRHSLLWGAPPAPPRRTFWEYGRSPHPPSTFDVRPEGQRQAVGLSMSAPLPGRSER
jgi:hypothetical protein